MQTVLRKPGAILKRVRVPGLISGTAFTGRTEPVRYSRRHFRALSGQEGLIRLDSLVTVRLSGRASQSEGAPANFGAFRSGSVSEMVVR